MSESLIVTLGLKDAGVNKQITAINKELRFLDKEFKIVNKYLIENCFLRNILRKHHYIVKAFRNILRKINRNKRINTIKPSHINACSFRNYLRKVYGSNFLYEHDSYN